MNTTSSFLVVVAFFALLLLVSYLASKKANSETFFTGNRRSPWFVVSFGMIGATISGVTFISVPGEVGNSSWTYLQFLMGNFVGYWVIALVLIPIYYNLNLVSIYTYLDNRLGKRSYKTGATFFLISQTIGASFRLYLVAGVMQLAFFNAIGVPFWATVLIIIFMIWLYTFRAGIKAVVWTDLLQTLFMLLSVALTIIVIARQSDLDIKGLVSTIDNHPYSRVFDWDLNSKTNFFKQFLAGIAIVIVMNGLDQNMMQKTLTCKTMREARKNLYWFSGAFILSNLLFLSLGILLYYYAAQKGIAIPEKTDDLFPMLVLNHFDALVGILFLLGITAAAYSSADSALTALTTSFCIDILSLDMSSKNSSNTRLKVHVGFSILVFLVIILFRILNNDSVVTSVFRVAGYTYGPLLGLFAFGIITHRKVVDKYVPYICILSPILCFLIDRNSEALLGGYKFGFELLVLNGVLTFLGLWMFSRKSTSSPGVNPMA